MIAEAWDAVIAIATASVALTAGLLAVRLPLRKAFGAGIAYLAWLVVPFALFAALLPAPLAPLVPIAIIETGATTAGPALVASVDAFDARIWMLALWLSGVLAAVAYFIVQQLRFSRRLARSRGTPISSRGVVRVEAGGPAVVGFWKPRIVLPVDFEARYSPEERELILAHEQVHLDRGDTRVNAAAAFARALNWFNPLIHYAASRMRIDQELACDAAVLAQFPRARRRYAEAMLKTRVDMMSSESSAPAVCDWNSEAIFKQRIAMLKRPLPGRRLRRSGHAAIVVLTGFASCLVWATQPTRSETREADSTEVVIDMKIDIEVDTGSKSIHLLSPSGKVVPIEFQDDGDVRWEADVLPQALAGGDIELSAVIRRDGETIAQPMMVLRPGVAGSLELFAGADRPQVRLQATLAKVDAGVQNMPAEQQPVDGATGSVDVSPKSTFTRATRGPGVAEGIDRQTYEGTWVLQANRRHVLIEGGVEGALGFELEVRPLADGRFELLARMSGEGIPPATEPRVVVSEGKPVRIGVGTHSPPENISPDGVFLGADIELKVSKSTGPKGSGVP